MNYFDDIRLGDVFAVGSHRFSAEEIKAFALRFDPAGALAKQFGVQTMPSSFLLDTEGNVIASHFGFRSSEAADYENSIKVALETVGAAR